jgi:2-aminoadipate transaminase
VALSSVPKRQRIGVDAESYPGALDAFRSAHATLVGLEDRAELYYVMPSVSNPCGQTMPDVQRDALLERAQRQGSYVLEDDAYDGTRFAGGPSRPLVADAPERVFHIGTFSKTLCPGLRLGWLVPPRRLARRALRRKQNQDLQTNGLTQALLVEYLRQGHFEALQARARKRYRRKAQTLLGSVARRLPEFRCRAPLGGFSLWLESDLRCDEARLLEAAIERGASFDPGSLFRVSTQPSLALRLSFSAVPEPAIDEGVARIARALEHVSARSRP